MAKTKHYINLTNGIDAIEEYKLQDYSFIRIKSTACEQKRFEEVLFTISDDFMMNAALGNICYVYDYGCNKKVPRALWQGLEFVKYCLYKNWYNIEYIPNYPRSKKCVPLFRTIYETLERATINRLNYYKKYLDGELNIFYLSDSTKNDGKDFYYKGMVKYYNDLP